MLGALRYSWGKQQESRGGGCGSLIWWEMDLEGNSAPAPSTGGLQVWVPELGRRRKQAHCFMQLHPSGLVPRCDVQGGTWLLA